MNLLAKELKDPNATEKSQSNSWKQMVGELNYFVELQNESTPRLDKHQQNIAPLEMALNRKYRVLLEMNERLLKKQDVNSDELKALYKDIDQQEKKIHSEYKKIVEALKEAYLSKREEILAKEKALIGKINIWLEQETSQMSPGAKEYWVEKLNKFKDLLVAYVNARDLFFMNKHKEWEQKLDFQAYYMIANFLMGKDVEGFCKSAKDRTGLLHQLIEEFLVYKKVRGQLPDYGDSDPDGAKKAIAARVYHGGISRDAAGMNIRGARGLQIGAVKNYGNRGKMENAMGKMAKNPYKPISRDEKSILKSIRVQ
jgi:hypothetical protein